MTNCRSIPAVIYKYCRYDSAEKILSTKSIRLQSAVEFNDPYDSHADISFSVNDKIIQKYYLNFLRTKRNANTSNLDESIITHPEFKKSAQDTIEEAIKKVAREQTRLACFSEVKNNILMFSHYADQHTGVCIGFNTDNILKLNPRFRIEKISYVSTPPKFNITLDILKSLFQIGNQLTDSDFGYLFSKFDEWSYEKEWRLFLLGKEDALKINSSSIREISYGTRMPSECKDNLTNLIKSSYDSCEVYHLGINPSMYQLIEYGIFDLP